jgi:O-antigen/teichoic acid export membrane protein
MVEALVARFTVLLRWSEKYTKVDMVYLASGTVWVIIGNIGAAVMALGTAVAFANLLSKETYGTYQYVLSGVALISLLALPGMKNAVSYAVSHNKDASFLEVVREKIAWGFLASFAAISVALYYYVNHNYLLTSAFAAVACFLPFWEAYGYYVPYLQGKREFGAITLYELAVQAINAAAIIAVMLFSHSLLVLLLAYFASWTIGRLYFFKRALKKYPPNNERDPATIGYGKHLSIMSILSALASNADKLLIWQFLGPAEVAIYTFALTVPSRITNSLASINRLYFPKAATRPLSEIRTVIVRRVLLLTAATTTIAVVYALLAPLLFELFFPKYLEAVPFTQILGVLVALQPFSLLVTALSAHAQKKELYIYNTVSPILQLGLYVILIPLYGVLGAALSITITQFVECLLVVGLFYFASKRPPAVTNE